MFEENKRSLEEKRSDVNGHLCAAIACAIVGLGTLIFYFRIGLLIFVASVILAMVFKGERNQIDNNLYQIIFDRMIDEKRSSETNIDEASGKNNSKKEKHIKTNPQGMKLIKCKSCGAKIIKNNIVTGMNIIIAKCDYCGRKNRFM